MVMVMVTVKSKRCFAWLGEYVGFEEGSWDPQEAVFGTVVWWESL